MAELGGDVRNELCSFDDRWLSVDEFLISPSFFRGQWTSEETSERKMRLENINELPYFYMDKSVHSGLLRDSGLLDVARRGSSSLEIYGDVRWTSITYFINYYLDLLKARTLYISNTCRCILGGWAKPPPFLPLKVNRTATLPGGWHHSHFLVIPVMLVV